MNLWMFLSYYYFITIIISTRSFNHSLVHSFSDISIINKEFDIKTEIIKDNPMLPNIIPAGTASFRIR